MTDFIKSTLTLFRALAFSLLVSSGFTTISAQDVAIKTNILDDIVILSPNIGVEVGLAPKWTLDVTGQVNFWNIKEHRLRHWAVQPEARYWLCQRFAGHFFGAHLLGGQYNVGNIDIPFKFLNTDYRKLKDQRFEGWGVGVGLAYGYAWPIGRHWNIEAEIGLGWVWTKYDAYPCTKCGKKIKSGVTHNYFGPTKAALGILYLF